MTKIYSRIVIDITSGEIVAEDSFDYTGDVAELKGPKAPKGQVSPSGQIVSKLFKEGPLRTSLEGILAPAEEDPYAQRQMDVLTQRVRGGYGARGLAGSGIAQQSEQDSLRDFLLSRGEQKQGQALTILGAGGTAPSYGPAQQPKGFLGLK